MHFAVALGMLSIFSSYNERSYTTPYLLSPPPSTQQEAFVREPACRTRILSRPISFCGFHPTAACGQSVTKISQKTVRYVSYIGHKTVRCKYVSELCKKRFGNASEMYHILIMCHKTVSALFGKLFEICQKYQFWLISDTFTIKMSLGQPQPTQLFCWNLSFGWEFWPQGKLE